MKLTTKGRYAVTALLDVAIHEHSGPVSIADISVRQDISVSYLEQLFSKMRKKQLVDSVRGPGGGYRINGDSNDISIAAIIDAVGEDVSVTRCEGEKDCQKGESCLTHHLWSNLSQQIHKFLSGISLKSLMDTAEVQKVAERQDKLTIKTTPDNI